MQDCVRRGARFTFTTPDAGTMSRLYSTKYFIQKPRPGPSQAGARPYITALAWPEIFQSWSPLRPGQSQGFWAKLGRNSPRLTTEQWRLITAEATIHSKRLPQDEANSEESPEVDLHAMLEL